MKSINLSVRNVSKFFWEIIYLNKDRLKKDFRENFFNKLNNLERLRSIANYNSGSISTIKCLLFIFILIKTGSSSFLSRIKKRKNLDKQFLNVLKKQQTSEKIKESYAYFIIYNSSKNKVKLQEKNLTGIQKLHFAGKKMLATIG